MGGSAAGALVFLLFGAVTGGVGLVVVGVAAAGLGFAGGSAGEKFGAEAAKLYNDGFEKYKKKSAYIRSQRVTQMNAIPTYFLPYILIIICACLVVGFLMIIGSWLYLNRLKKRARLIELVWGVNNEWHKGTRFDVVMANIIAASVFTAWRMKIGLISKKQREIGAFAYPMLHRNGNYEKLLREFPLLVRWETVKTLSLIIGVCGIFIY